MLESLGLQQHAVYLFFCSLAKPGSLYVQRGLKTVDSCLSAGFSCTHSKSRRSPDPLGPTMADAQDGLARWQPLLSVVT